MVLPQYFFVRGCSPKPLCVSLNNAWRYGLKRISLKTKQHLEALISWDEAILFSKMNQHQRNTREQLLREIPSSAAWWIINEPKSSILHQKRHQNSFWRQPLDFKPLQNIKTHWMCSLCVQRHEKAWLTSSDFRMRCCINVWYWEAWFKYTFTLIWVFFLFLIVKEWQSSVMCIS